MRIRLVILFLFIASLSFGQANNWLFGVNSNQGNPSGPDTIAMPYSGDLLLFHQAGIGITEDANGVSQWNDLSGNGNHSTQSTNTNKPTTDVNGNIVFDGVNDFMNMVSLLTTSNDTSLTFIIAGTATDIDGTETMFMVQDSDSDFLLIISLSGGDSIALNTAFRENANNTVLVVSDSILDGQSYLTTYGVSEGLEQITITFNGVQYDTTFTAPYGYATGGQDNITLGASSNGTSNFYNGKISLIAIYDRKLNISEIHEVEQAINDYYSIYTDPQLQLSYSSDLLLYHLAGYGVTSDANGVSQWDDLSGNNNHSTQGTTANKPTLSNTDGSIVFDGTDDWLEVSDLFTNTTDTAFTLFIVAETGSTREDSFSLILWYEQGLDGNVDSSILIRIALDSIASQSTNHKLEFSVRDEGNGYLNWTKRVDTIGLNTQFLGTIAARESSYADFKVNGLQRDTLQFDGTWYGATSVTKSISGFRGSSLFFNGKISLIAIYNRKLNISEITEVENAINTYFSIY